MLDRYGRVINYLRISVTDRCNLRCCYCMPEGVQDVGMKNILTFEEIWEIVRTGVSLGITHIRITGGEPLVRKGCVDLIRGIRLKPDKAWSAGKQLLRQLGWEEKKQPQMSEPKSTDVKDTWIMWMTEYYMQMVLNRITLSSGKN